jgi:hypothetical protein
MNTEHEISNQAAATVTRILQTLLEGGSIIPESNVADIESVIEALGWADRILITPSGDESVA